MFLNGNFLENFWLLLKLWISLQSVVEQKKMDYFHRAQITPVFFKVW